MIVGIGKLPSTPVYAKAASADRKIRWWMRGPLRWKPITINVIDAYPLVPYSYWKNVRTGETLMSMPDESVVREWGALKAQPIVMGDEFIYIGNALA